MIMKGFVLKKPLMSDFKSRSFYINDTHRVKFCFTQFSTRIY